MFRIYKLLGKGWEIRLNRRGVLNTLYVRLSHIKSLKSDGFYNVAQRPDTLNNTMIRA